MKLIFCFAVLLATTAVVLGQTRFSIRYPTEMSSDKDKDDAKTWQNMNSDISKSKYDKIASENEIDSDETYETSKEESTTSTEVPTTNEPSTFSRIINTVLQVPVSIFRSLGSFFTSAPLTRLRDEMNKLNISYPKN